MRLRLLSAAVLGLAACAASAQDSPATAPTAQAPAPAAAPASPSGEGGWQGRRGGHGGWGGAGLEGRGVAGTVTEAAADHYTIKTDAGETYVIHFSANTRILKRTGQSRGEDGEGGGNPPQAIKPTDIKAGDAIAAVGEIDAAAKSVGAVVVFQIDPERTRQMREMQANFGKTWLAGKVTAIDGVKVALLGINDNSAHAFVADENTAFRKHRVPVTLADLQVGDMVRAGGAVKNGIFTAASVVVIGPQSKESDGAPRKAVPAPAPQSNPQQSK